MRFTPLSDEELAKQRGCLTPGEADFEILGAKDTVSKKGSPMMKLELQVWDSEGQEGYVYDYITEIFQWKLKNLLSSVGLGKLYESGDIDPANLVGRAGKAKIYIKKDEKYGDRTQIRDYLPVTNGAVPVVQKQPSQPKNDDDVPW